MCGEHVWVVEFEESSQTALFFAIMCTADVYFEKADEDWGSAEDVPVPETLLSFKNHPSQNQPAVFTVMWMHLGVSVWQSRNRGIVIMWAFSNCGLA